MILSCQRLLLLLMAAFISVDCAATFASPSKPMSITEAKSELLESLKLSNWNSIGIIRVTRDKIVLRSRTSSNEGRYYFSSQDDLSIKSHSGLPGLNIKGKGFTPGEPPKDITVEIYWDKKYKRYATMFADAIQVLKQAPLGSDPEEEASFAAFSASAKSWVIAAPKPEMSDDARAYKMLAEDAFKRKDFPTALEAYGKAVELFPMWPSGHYNTALLAAEDADYELAAHHMRRYLVLAPDAQDATAAKDKLLLWQLKAKAEANAAFMRPNPLTTPKASPTR